MTIDIKKNNESLYAPDNIDKKLLDFIQKKFPVSKRPFSEIGNAIGITENEALCRIKDLYERKFIKFIGSIIDTKALGFQSMLAAFRVKENLIPDTVKILNSYPGVSHNYLRNAFYNIWFTIATPPEIGLKETIKKIADISNTENYLEFPSLKIFKIGLMLNVEKNGNNHFEKNDSISFQKKKSEKINEVEYQIIKLVQHSIPIAFTPFQTMALASGLKEEIIIENINDLINKGIIKRFGAILAHQKIGYTSNTLALWEIPEDKIDSYGKFISSFQNVSHCYSRQSYPDWNYSLYSMIHAHNDEKMQEIINKILFKTGKIKYLLLKSIKEFKKERLVYFSDEYKKWHEMHQV